MGLQTSFDALSEIVEECESRCRSVEHVEATANDTTGELDVTLSLRTAPFAGASERRERIIDVESASLTDGRITVECSLAEFVPRVVETATVSVAGQSARIDGDELVVRAELHVESDGKREPTDEEHTETEATDDPKSSSAGETGKQSRLEAARNETLQPYEDTEYLQELYESCETFTEMSELIPMDVASETVRRYMIDAEIHDPNSYETTEESVSDRTEDTSASLETLPDEQLVTDGIGLPEGVQLDDVVEVVADATSVYEVQRSLGVDNCQARSLLRQLDLLDLVMHRLDEPKRVSRAEAIDRINQCLPNESGRRDAA